MESPGHDTAPSRWRAASIGVAIGVGVLGLFLIAGILLASWSVSEFRSQLSLDTIGWLLLSSGFAIATIAIPIALFLRARLRSPLVLLVVLVVGWLTIGLTSGSIERGAIFGLSVYAVGLSPVYLVLYLVFGGGEYYARSRART